MYEEDLENSFNATTSNNLAFTSANVLQIRLDSSAILENVELYLKGEQIITSRTEAGNIIEKRKVVGRPKANSQGVHSILNYLSSIVNPQVVQGNFASEGKGQSAQYENYIEEVNIDLAKMIVLNMYYWDVREEDIDEICDFAMKLIIPFVTRLIDNKERDSYGNTIQHREVNTVNDRNSGGFRSFLNRGG